jgi:MFS family permease
MKQAVQWRNANPNVRWAFIYTALQSFGRGIWMGNILSLYIVLFAEQSQGIFGLTSNELLGVTSGVTGISMTLIVFPAGWWADRFRRDRMLRIAAIFGLAAMLSIVLAAGIIPIMAALLLWGVFQGISRPAYEAILADSLQTGNRSGTYSRIHLVDQVAMATGPFLNVILFMIFGDNWDIGILRAVMQIGIAVSILSVLTLFFFKDASSMGQDSDSLYEHAHTTADEYENKRARKIPILLVGSNIIIGVGAGMTIKFFPVFFRAIYHLQPIKVQLIMGVTAIVTGLFGVLAQKFSLRRGRGEMIFGVQFIATICLFAIAFYPPLFLLIPLFVLRGSLMNAAQPLSRSILMDVVPKRHRGKWNSLETIAWGLFWNASAMVGGFLIGDNNFRLCFLITAGVYLVGTVPILMLIPLVHKETAHQQLEQASS